MFDAMAETENPYEPRECRVCDKPVTVEQVRSEGMVSRSELVRRCYNPQCRLNTADRRESDKP